MESVIERLKCMFKYNKNQLLLFCTIILFVSLFVTTWFYTNPIVNQEFETRTEYNYTFDFSVTGEVEQTTSMYEKGEIVRDSRFYQAKAFDGLTYDFSLDNNVDENTGKAIVVFELQGSVDDNVFWTEEVTSTVVEAGESKSILINMDDISERRSEIVSETRRRVSVDMVMRTEILEGDTVVDNKEIGVSVGEELIVFESPPGSIDFSRENEVLVSSSQKYDQRMYIAILISVLSLIMVIIITIASRDIDDRTFWEYKIYKNDEIIKRGEYSGELVETRTEVEKVEDLIDIAIDEKAAAIYDETKGLVYVQGDNQLFYSSKPGKNPMNWVF